MWQRRAEQLLLEPIDDYFHYATPGLGSQLRSWRVLEWEGRHEWGKRRGAFAVQYLPYFDNELAKRPFVAGETFSMADITLFVSSGFCDIAGLPIAPELTTLAAWRARVSAIPSVKNRSGRDILPGDLARLAG